MRPLRPVGPMEAARRGVGSVEESVPAVARSSGG